MDQRVEERKKNFQENLCPHEYHKLVHEELEYISDMYFGGLESLYKIMKKGKFKGRRLLEIGSGPTVHHIASASAYFPEIVQSDFVEANCEELRKWHSGKSDLDWSQFLNTVAKIEGYADINSGVREIEERIRRSVTSVVHCDVLSDQVVPPEVAMPYDLIITSLVLECSAVDFENYITVLKRVNGLLREGGGLIMMGFLGMEKWATKSAEFRCVILKQSEIQKALEAAGFKEMEWALVPEIKDVPKFVAFKGHFVVAATKA